MILGKGEEMSSKEESLQKYKVKLNGEPKLVFNDYKKTSMYLPIGYTCTGKCWKDLGLKESICHNWENNGLYNEYIISELLDMYKNNPFYESVVISGMECMDNFEDMIVFIEEFRLKYEHDIVIFTGYNKNEIKNKIGILKNYKNIIIKMGRYVENSIPNDDVLLGTTLASSNQYAIKIEDL